MGKPRKSLNVQEGQQNRNQTEKPRESLNAEEGQQNRNQTRKAQKIFKRRGGALSSNHTGKPRKSLNVEEGHYSAVIHSSLKNFETQKKSTNLVKKSSNISKQLKQEARVCIQTNPDKIRTSIYGLLIDK